MVRKALGENRIPLGLLAQYASTALPEEIVLAAVQEGRLDIAFALRHGCRLSAENAAMLVRQGLMTGEQFARRFAAHASQEKLQQHAALALDLVRESHLSLGDFAQYFPWAHDLAKALKKEWVIKKRDLYWHFPQHYARPELEGRFWNGFASAGELTFAEFGRLYPNSERIDAHIRSLEAPGEGQNLALLEERVLSLSPETRRRLGRERVVDYAGTHEQRLRFLRLFGEPEPEIAQLWFMATEEHQADEFFRALYTGWGPSDAMSRVWVLSFVGGLHADAPMHEVVNGLSQRIARTLRGLPVDEKRQLFVRRLLAAAAQRDVAAAAAAGAAGGSDAEPFECLACGDEKTERAGHLAGPCAGGAMDVCLDCLTDHQRSNIAPVCGMGECQAPVLVDEIALHTGNAAAADALAKEILAPLQNRDDWAACTTEACGTGGIVPENGPRVNFECPCCEQRQVLGALRIATPVLMDLIRKLPAERRDILLRMNVRIDTVAEQQAAAELVLTLLRGMNDERNQGDSNGHGPIRQLFCCGVQAEKNDGCDHMTCRGAMAVVATPNGLMVVAPFIRGEP